MKKIAILGSSATAIDAIEVLKGKDPSYEVTVFMMDNSLPLNQKELNSYIAGQVRQEQTAYRSQEIYQSLNIQFNDQKISRINLKKNLITTEEKNKIDYDLLFIADTGAEKFPDIKGTNKSGVYSLKRPSHLYEIGSKAPLSDTAVVVGGGLRGLQTACALRKRKLEVIWVVAESRVLSSLVDEESSGFLLRLLEETGIQIVLESGVTEILGDSDVKAVKVKSEKVFAAQIVVLGNSKVDLKLFKDTGLQITKGITVNEKFQTNFENVFALDRACQSDMSQQQYDTYEIILKQQAQAIAGYLTGESQNNESFIKSSSFTINSFPVTLLGNTQGSEQVRIYRKIIEETRYCKKIFVRDGRVQGAILVNADGEKEEILKLIQDQVQLPEGEAPILQETTLLTYETQLEPVETSIHTQTDAPEAGSTQETSQLGNQSENAELS